MLQENVAEIIDFHYKLLRFTTITFISSLSIVGVIAINYAFDPILIDCIRYFIFEVENLEWPFVAKLEYEFKKNCYFQYSQKFVLISVTITT